MVYKCEICKDCPEILIFDGNSKLRCSLAFDRMVDASSRPQDGKVDCSAFWGDNSVIGFPGCLVGKNLSWISESLP